MQDVLNQNKTFNYEKLYMSYWKRKIWNFRPQELAEVRLIYK
jgi:hypothetical protein